MGACRSAEVIAPTIRVTGTGRTPALARMARPSSPATHVSSRSSEGWPIDLAGLTDRALRNLRRRARDAHDFDLVSEPIAGVLTTAFQSRDGWASTAVLVPEALARLFGPAPALLIAPSRDLLIALPDDVDLEFATWLAEEFEADDPNALRLEGFEWRDGVVRCRPLARDAVAV